MKTIKAFLLWAVVLSSALAPLQAQTPVRVTADNVNLRSKAVPTADVVGQVNYDDRLSAFEIGDEWVEVAAPATADLWVMKSYVQTPGNTVGANRVNLRAGPGINYNIVATLSLGDKIEPRGEEVAEWLKVAPPPAAHVFVSRDYVEIVSGTNALAKNDKKDAKIAEKSEKTGETAEISGKTDQNDSAEAAGAEKSSKKRKSKAKTDETAIEAAATALGGVIPTPIVSPSTPEKDSVVREIPVPPPADLKLIPLEGQGRLTEVEGELRAAPLINEAPTRYRVVRWQNNRWQILCHVYGEAAKFRSLQNKRVALKGREYWIQGAAAPVLIPDQVQEIPAGAESGEE